MTEKTTGNTNDFKKIVAMAKEYQFDESILNSVTLNGILRKTEDSEKFVLVISEGTKGEQSIEIKTKDVIKYEKISQDEKDNHLVKVFVKPETPLVQKTQGTAKLYSTRSGDARPTGLPDWVDWTAIEDVMDRLRDRLDIDPDPLPPPPLTPHQEQCYKQFRESMKWLADESSRRHKEIESWTLQLSNSIRSQRDQCLRSQPGTLVQI